MMMMMMIMMMEVIMMIMVVITRCMYGLLTDAAGQLRGDLEVSSDWSVSIILSSDWSVSKYYTKLV